MTIHEQGAETQKVLRSYRPSSYTDATWPSIEVPTSSTTSFEPAQFEHVGGTSPVTHPMFSDFGTDAAVDPAIQESGALALEEDYASERDRMSYDAAAQMGGEGYEDSTRAPQSGASAQPVVSAGIDPEVHEAAVAQAAQEGYALGCADTRGEVQLLQQQLEERYTILWEDMQTQLTETARAHEQYAIELAFQIARRMVGAVVDSQREYVVSVIKEAVQVAGSSEIKAVRVSPQDYEFLKLNGYGERIKIYGDSKLVFESDESIRAGCIVVTNAGEIDFDLDKAWARMHEKALQGPKS